MLSTKHAALAVKILSLLLVAALSFFVAAAVVPESGFVKSALESVEESSDTVMKFSAATLSASLGISALPDDFASPLAESLSDMNVYFIFILVVLFLEKILIQFGVELAFTWLIPIACALGILCTLTKKQVLRSFAVRLCVLALAVAFVVPCSTHLSDVVAADLTAYVEQTIAETESGAGKLDEVMEDSDGQQNMFEKFSDLFHSAISDMSDLLLHFRNTIRKCMNSIAILILTNILMPLLTFFVLKWILKEVFQIALPALPALPVKQSAAAETEPALTAAGGTSHEE